MLIVPSIIKATTKGEAIASSADVAESLNASNPAEGNPHPIEIPFVPAAQRKSLINRDPIEDSIVVVGQTQQKKRKRTKAIALQDPDKRDSSVDGSDKSASKRAKSSKTDEQSVPLEAFDYSTVSNILDDAPAPSHDSNERVKKKKRHFVKGGISMQFGNFPAPPKAHREVKSGNQTRTFN